jgi:hypothetical protein
LQALVYPLQTYILISGLEIRGAIEQPVVRSISV